MTYLFTDTVQAILLAVVAVFFGLNWLARRQPRIAWLRVFRLPEIPLSEEQKRRRRRMANRISGLEFVAMGLGLPLVYIAATVMMFNNFDPLPTALVALASAGCVMLGVRVFWKNR